jgi:hypothetical protein
MGLRWLGAGGPRIGDGLREWNGYGGNDGPDPPLIGSLIVGYDAVGEFYVMSDGQGTDRKTSISYLTPDTYQREEFDRGYSDFLTFSLSGTFDAFSEGHRWPGWEAEVAALGPDQVISMVPPLGFNREVAVADRSRRPVSARAFWGLRFSIARQIRSPERH